MASGGKLVGEALAAHGIKVIFSLTGGQILSVYDALIDKGVKIIGTRHEQAAGFMADAFARLSASPAVCLVSAGPGFSNVLTSLATAYRAGTPAIFLSGSAPLKERGQMAFQELDQLALARPITKWCRQVKETREIVNSLKLAFEKSMAGAPGPVYVDLPQDVLEKEGDEPRDWAIGPFGSRPGPGPDSRTISRTVSMLLSATRPLVFAGSGVWYSQAQTELKEFIETLGAPVFTANLGRGIVPDNLSLSLGGPNLVPGGVLSLALRKTDLVIILGHRFNHWAMLNPQAQAIQVDIDSKELGRNARTTLRILADIKLALAAINSEIKGKVSRRPTLWLKRLQQARKMEFAHLLPKKKGDRGMIHPFRLCLLVDASLPKEATVVADGGDTSVWMRMAKRTQGPGRFLDAGPLRTLGTGIPFALAAKLKSPEKQVVLVSGDGSVGFGFMEFHTAIKHSLPIVVVVNNDKAWGLIKHSQAMRYGPERVVGAELGLVRYDRLIKELGGYGELVRKEEEIRPALLRAFRSGKPACLNVLTDPTVFSPAAAQWAGKVSLDPEVSEPKGTLKGAIKWSSALLRKRRGKYFSPVKPWP